MRGLVSHESLLFKNISRLYLVFIVSVLGSGCATPNKMRISGDKKIVILSLSFFSSTDNSFQSLKLQTFGYFDTKITNHGPTLFNH